MPEEGQAPARDMEAIQAEHYRDGTTRRSFEGYPLIPHMGLHLFVRRMRGGRTTRLVPYWNGYSWYIGTAATTKVLSPAAMKEEAEKRRWLYRGYLPDPETNQNEHLKVRYLVQFLDRTDTRGSENFRNLLRVWRSTIPPMRVYTCPIDDRDRVVRELRNQPELANAAFVSDIPLGGMATILVY